MKFNTDTLPQGEKTIRFTVNSGEFNVNKMIFSYALNSVEENLSKINAAAFPSPFNTILHLNSDTEGTASLYSLQGDVILQNINLSKETRLSLDLPAGVYVVEIQNKEGIARQKIIKN